MPTKINSVYLQNAHRHPSTLARAARKHLDGVEFDTLVGTGLSGALVIPGLARELKASWMIVRKDDDGSHSSHRVEGEIGARWLFVDDFISSGATRRRVINRIEQAAQRYDFVTTYVGDYLYGWPDVHPPHFAAAEPPPMEHIIKPAEEAYVTFTLKTMDFA